MRDNYGWTDYDAEPAATIPGEAISIYGAEDEPEAWLLQNDDMDGYYIERVDGTYVYNPKSGNALFADPEGARKQGAGVAKEPEQGVRLANDLSAKESPAGSHSAETLGAFRGWHNRPSRRAVGRGGKRNTAKRFYQRCDSSSPANKRVICWLARLKRTRVTLAACAKAAEAVVQWAKCPSLAY